MKFKIFVAIAAAALVPTAAIAAGDCCQPGAECCKDGQDCCDKAARSEHHGAHR